MWPHTSHEGGLEVYSPRKFLKFEARKCHFLRSEHPNLLVFETKEGKNAQKVKKILTIIFRYLLGGGGGGIAMAEGHVCGHTDAENVWNLKPGNGISCILSIQICSKIYAKYTCI